MVQIILNEKEYAEDLLKWRTFNDNLPQALSVISRYYLSQGYSQPEIERLLEDFIIKCDPCANLVKLQDLVERQVKRAGKRKMVEINCVSVSKQELDEIGVLKSVGHKKVAFTMLCLAKFYNQVNLRNNNWVNKDVRDIFKLAAVNLKKEAQDKLLRSLIDLEYISESKVIGKPNFRVLKVFEGEPELIIRDFRNVGNQYMKYMGKKYIECANCGLVIYQNGNAQRYCKQCASEVRKLRKK